MAAILACRNSHQSSNKLQEPETKAASAAATSAEHTFPFSKAEDSTGQEINRLLAKRVLSGDASSATELRKSLAHDDAWREYSAALLSLTEGSNRDKDVLRLGLGIAMFCSPNEKAYLKDMVDKLTDEETVYCGKEAIMGLRMSDELLLASKLQARRSRLVQVDLARVTAEWSGRETELVSAQRTGTAAAQRDLLSLAWLNLRSGRISEAKKMLGFLDTQNAVAEVLEVRAMVEGVEADFLKLKETGSALWTISEPKGLSLFAMACLQKGLFKEFDEKLELFMYFRKADASLLNSLIAYCGHLGKDSNGKQLLIKVFEGVSVDFLSERQDVEKTFDNVLATLEMTREDVFGN